MQPIKKNYLDRLRIFAILLVFFYHYIIITGKQGFFLHHANGDWGHVGTTLFFLISGNCLARIYGENMDWKVFYKKRWLSIFPAFYLTYILVFLGHTLILHNDLILGRPLWWFIYTLLGIDHYIGFIGITSFALVGEWYTTMIVGIYIIFPLLQFMYRKNKLISSLVVATVFLLNMHFTWTGFPDEVHLITCATIFWIGMMSHHFEKQLENLPWLAWFTLLAILCVFLFVEVSLPYLYRKCSVPLLIFVLFMRTEPFWKPTSDSPVLAYLCKIEYAVYLCHHSVLYVMQSLYIRFFGALEPVSYFLISLLLSIAFAALITYCIDLLLGRKKLKHRKKA